MVISHTARDADNGGLSLFELSALGCINSRAKDGHSQAKQTTHHAMCESLVISKAAVSQMLGSLEKKGYIQREINPSNRRKIVITLTKKGKISIDNAEKSIDDLMMRIIERFGEENSRNLACLLNRFTESVDEIVS
jgi:DNA-binding MarR family transcriptional regulator